MGIIKRCTGKLAGAACAVLLFAAAPCAAFDFNLVTSVTVNGQANSQDQGGALDFDAAGNVYTVGNVCRAGVVESCYDIWIAKYSPDLVLIASRTVNGTANGQDTGEDIDVDAAGNVWVTGEINNTGTYMDVWVGKYDSNLNLLVSTSINGANASSADIGRGIHVSSSGAVYVTGNIQDHMWIGKFDQNLALTGSHTVNYHVQYEYGFDVKTDPDGNLWATGQVFKNITSEDFWLGKFTPNLVAISSVTMHNSLSASDVGRGLAIDASGYVYATGGSGNTGNIYLAKYTPSLVLVASRTINGSENSLDLGRRVSVGPDGTLWAAGYVDETGVWDNAWLAHYSPSLELISSATFRGSENAWDHASDIGVDPYGNTWAVGYITEAAGDQNIWLAKFSSAPPAGQLGAAPMSGVSTGAAAVNWTSSFADGTAYYVRLSSFASPAVYVASGSTTALSYGFGGLAANASYYGYVSTAAEVGFTLAGSTITRIETPTSVYFDEIATTSIVASAYAPSPAFTGIGAGLSGVALTTGAVYGGWTAGGDAWATKADLLTGRHGAAAGAIGGKIYLVGGFDTAQNTRNEEYDPVSNAWTARADMAYARRYHAVAVTGGKLYAIGGDNSAFINKNEAYDPESNTWTTRANLSSGRHGLAAGVVNGKIYVVGGNNGTVLATTQEYNPQTNSWTTKTAMPTARDQHAVAVIDGKLYALGGMDVASYSNKNEVYDPAANTWTTKAALPFSRSGLGAAAAGGKIYAVGGINGVNSNINQEYDPAADAWVVRTPMPTARRYPAVAALNGRIYAMGGIAVGQSAKNEEYNTGRAAVFAGLAPNTLYAFKARARNQSGAETGDSAIVSTYTLALVPDASMVSGLGVSSVTVLWGDGGNPAGTDYYAELSTDSAFGGTVYTAAPTTFNYTSFTGLAPGTFYYGRARARNHAGFYTAYNQANFALTFPMPPSSAAYTSVEFTTIAFSWSANGNPAGTPFYAAVSTAADFTAEISSQTDLTSAAFYGLVPNTTYYARVRTLGTPSSVYTVLAATATRANPAGAGAVADITGAVLGTTSVRWTWSAGTVASADGFVLLSTANVFIASAPFSLAGGTYTQTGLGANRPVSVQIAPYVAGAIGALRQGPTYYTFAAVPDGVISALVVSTNAVYGEWDDLANPPGTLYQLWRATAADFAGADISSVTNSPHLILGLTPNTRYYGRARAVNGDGLPGGFTAAAAASTLANPPAGLSALVYITSAALAWNLNNNPAGTEARVLRHNTGTGSETTLAAAATAYVDTGLLGCTTYYYAVWNLNRDGVRTASAATGEFLTGTPVPAPPGSLYAAALAGGRIQLTWEPSPFEGITGYNLYYDNGTGTVNYGAPLYAAGAGERGWTTGVLASSAAYTFALRAAHRCGAEEANTTVRAVSPALPALTGVRAAIKIPQTGKRVNGNSVTVMAELITGTPAETKNILFQYKTSAAAAWTNIVAANANHPNPDASKPYFVHWDVTGLVSGSYDLRAVAYNLANAADPAPGAITIAVDSVDPDIVESTQTAGGEVTKVQKVNNLVDNTLQSGDPENSQVTMVTIPAGALDYSTATVTVVNNPASAPPPPEDAGAVGVVAQITLSSQTLLAGGQTAEVTLVYPDADNDGVVDGSSLLAGKLEMYSAATSAGPWQRDLNSVVDPAGKKVTGHTSHFSFFALFGPVAAGLDSARAYPVPWRPGSGGDYDSPPGAAGIVFDNLTATAEIKIFTVSGQLVWEYKLSAGNLGFKAWDGKNSAGNNAASGIYLAHIKSGKRTKVLKVAIER